MIAAIVRGAIFVSLMFSLVVFAQPPDEEILFVFTNTVDNFRSSLEQLKLINGDLLKGTSSQKGFCALVEKHIDYTKYAHLSIEKLKFEAEPSDVEKQVFVAAIKSEIANYMVGLFHDFPKDLSTQLRIKFLHPHYALIQLIRPSKPDIVFLTERAARIYPILDIIESDVSKIGNQQMEFQNILKSSNIKTLNTLVENLNNKNLSENNYGLCN